MRFLLDTNVISELRKGNNADKHVRDWFGTVDGEAVFLSVLSLGEIRHGIERVRRRDTTQAEFLEAWLNDLEVHMESQLLSVTQAIADCWGHLGVPDPVPDIDGLLAATALVHDLTIVTRNTKDFERTHVKLINPFIKFL